MFKFYLILCILLNIGSIRTDLRLCTSNRDFDSQPRRILTGSYPLLFGIFRKLHRNLCSFYLI